MNYNGDTNHTDEARIPRMQLAQAYFVFQKYDGLFPPAEALCEGTIFPEFLGPKRVDPPEEERVEDYA